MRLLVFGCGYSALVFARRLIAQGWRVTGTSRDAARRAELTHAGLDTLDPAEGSRLAVAAREAEAVLVSPAPTPDGCPGLAALRASLAAAAPKWIGYLSTTGVYGDRHGRWVDETSALAARSTEGVRRVRAEQDWLAFAQEHGHAAAVFRLPGLYGPGRSALDRVRAGRATRTIKPGQVFSRLHVDDLARGLEASLARPRGGAIYNLCDDEPAPPADVTAYACALLGVEPPPEVLLDETELSPLAQRFWAESKRVSNARAKAELGWRPGYPSYREGLNAIFSVEL